MVERLVVIKLPTFITLSLSLHCFYPNLTGKDIHSLQNVWSSFFVWIVFGKRFVLYAKTHEHAETIVTIGLGTRQCWGGFNVCLPRTSLLYFSVLDDPHLVGSFLNLKQLKVRRKKLRWQTYLFMLSHKYNLNDNRSIIIILIASITARNTVWDFSREHNKTIQIGNHFLISLKFNNFHKETKKKLLEKYVNEC